MSVQLHLLAGQPETRDDIETLSLGVAHAKSLSGEGGRYSGVVMHGGMVTHFALAFGGDLVTCGQLDNRPIVATGELFDFTLDENFLDENYLIVDNVIES